MKISVDQYRKLGIVSLRFFGTFAAFLMHFTIAVKLGASKAGMFYIVFAIVSIASTISRLGLDYAVTKYVSEYTSEKNNKSVSAIYRFSVIAILLMGTILTTLLVAISQPLAVGVFGLSDLQIVLIVMSLGILPYSLLVMTAHAFQGSSDIALAVFFQVILHPLLMTLLFVTIFSTYGLNGAAYAFTVSAFVSFVFVYYAWHIKKPVDGYSNVDRNAVFRVSLPILVSFLSQQALQHTPVILLGILSTTAQAGIYGVSHRLVSVVSIAVVAANFIVAPKAASYYAAGKLDKLQQLAHRGSEVSLLVGGPILVFLLLFPEFVLSFFGDEYIAGKLVLCVLLIGQFSNLLNGSGSILLMMTVGQVKFMLINFCGFLTCFIVALGMIPLFDSIAAASSVSIALCTINIWRYWATKSLIGISSLPRMPNLSR